VKLRDSLPLKKPDNQECDMDRYRKTLLWSVMGFVFPAMNLAAAQPLSEDFSYDNFKAYVNESFRVYGGQGLGLVVSLELIGIEVQQLDDHAEFFILHLSGPATRPLAKDVYFFEHPKSGKFRLFIEPNPDKLADPQARYYISQLNRSAE
jgi:hypothetical protein